MLDLSFQPATTADLPAMQELFVAAIQLGAAGEYSQRQRDAWAASAQKTGRWRGLISEQFCVLAYAEEELAGFISLKEGDYIDFIYVHPDYTGRGVAAQLYELVALQARQYGARELYSDVSKTAKDFFLARGWRVERENIVRTEEGVELLNFRMRSGAVAGARS